MVVLQAALPTAGMGQLLDRDSSGSYGGEGERNMYVAAAGEGGRFYRRLANGFATKSICVDLFVHTAHASFADVATVGQVVAATGGQSFLYQGERLPADKMSHELARLLQRTAGTEAVLKLRCSAGVRVRELFGNFFVGRSGTAADQAELAGIDCDKAIAAELEYVPGEQAELGDTCYIQVGDYSLACDTCFYFSYFFRLTRDSTSSTSTLVFRSHSSACWLCFCLPSNHQCALLYTSSEGRRLLRLHNMALPATDMLADVFRFSDIETLLCFMQVRQPATTTTTTTTTIARAHAR